MITFFAILAMVADFGHTVYPNSPLNWWVAVYSLIAGLSCIMQMVQIYDDMSHGGPLSFRLMNLKPFMVDLTSTLILTWVYYASSI